MHLWFPLQLSKAYLLHMVYSEEWNVAHLVKSALETGSPHMIQWASGCYKGARTSWSGGPFKLLMKTNPLFLLSCFSSSLPRRGHHDGWRRGVFESGGSPRAGRRLFAGTLPGQLQLHEPQPRQVKNNTHTHTHTHTHMLTHRPWCTCKHFKKTNATCFSNRSQHTSTHQSFCQREGVLIEDMLTSHQVRTKQFLKSVLLSFCWFYI